MFSLSSSKSVDFRLEFERTVYFVHPNSLDDAANAVVTGDLVVTLTKARSFTTLEIVRNVAFCANLQKAGGPKEKGVLETSSHDLLEGTPRSLPPGVHRFPFVFVEAKDAAPDVLLPSGNGTYGDSIDVIWDVYTMREISITAVDSKGKTWAKSFSLADPAVYQPKVRRPLQHAIYHIAHSNMPPHELPAPLSVSVEGFSAETGPCIFAMYSPSLTLGGLVQFDIRFVDPSMDCQIYNVQAAIIQEATWRSPVDGKLYVFPTRKIAISDVAGNFKACVGKWLNPGKELQIHAVGRLPDDMAAGYTTNPLSNLPLSISHTILVSVGVSILGVGDRRLSATSKNIDMAACSAIAPHILLPAYSAQRPEEVTFKEWQPLRSDDIWGCCCGISYETLFQQMSPSAKLVESQVSMDPAPKLV